MSMQQIQTLTEAFSAKREALLEAMSSLEAEIQFLVARDRAAIRKLTGDVAKAEDALRRAIEANPKLFDKPKTQIFAGIQVGFRKQKGSIVIDDVDQTVKLIRKQLPELADLLIKTEETPIKKAMDQLDGAQLRKIGASIKDAGDGVVIAAVDGEVDKLAAALLKGARSKLDEVEA